jgi:lactoylglutathione lyase
MNRSRAPLAAVWLSLCTGIFALSANAQGPVPDHVEILAPDPAKAIAWYAAHMGAVSTLPDRVAYGGMQLIVHKQNDELGSKIDHLAIGVAKVDAKVKELTGAGATLVTRRGELPVKTAFVQDPWGALIEVVEDPIPLGFHHIHLRSVDPAATLTRYQELFGGERKRFKGKMDGLFYGPVWLLASKPAGTAPAINLFNHFAFLVRDFDTAFAELQKKGLKPVTELETVRGLKTIYLGGPDGQPVEIIQRPAAAPPPQ